MSAPIRQLLGSVLQRGVSYGIPKSPPIFKAGNNLRQLSILTAAPPRAEFQPAASLTVSNPAFRQTVGCCIGHGSLLKASLPYYNSSRTVVRYSLRKGRPKTVKAVTKRFFRLHWGIWIRTRAGRKKRLWQRNDAERLRFKYHVFCNKTQSKMLDKMVTQFWKSPKYYVDDPYAPYHQRTGMEKVFPDHKKPGITKWYP